jgi:hypothetical protein
MALGGNQPFSFYLNNRKHFLIVLYVPATHYNFLREIPMLASYEVRMCIIAWDQKWVRPTFRYLSSSRFLSFHTFFSHPSFSSFPVSSHTQNPVPDPNPLHLPAQHRRFPTKNNHSRPPCVSPLRSSQAPTHLHLGPNVPNTTTTVAAPATSRKSSKLSSKQTCNQNQTARLFIVCRFRNCVSSMGGSRFLPPLRWLGMGFVHRPVMVSVIVILSLVLDLVLNLVYGK